MNPRAQDITHFAPLQINGVGLLSRVPNWSESNPRKELQIQWKRYANLGRGARIRTGDLLRPRQARYQAAPRPELNVPIILPSLEDCVQSDSAQAMQSIVFSRNSGHKVAREFNAKHTFGTSSGLTVPKSPPEPNPTARSTSVLLEYADWHGT